MLIEAAGRIATIANLESRTCYARALAASLTLDISGHRPPDIMSPKDIANDKSIHIPLGDLDNLNVILRRRQIKEFMSTYFGRKLKDSEITLWFKAQAYKKFFERHISKLGNSTDRSATVYTYAEVLHVLKVRSPQQLGGNEQINLPDEVMQLFSDCQVSFPYSRSE